VLNSQIIQGLENSNKLAEAQVRWFDNELAKPQNKPIHTVAMCHIPPFCWDFKEDDCNFNWPSGKRKKWLDKMVQANVKKIYCAHYHRRARGEYKGLEVVVSAALGTCIRTKPLPNEIRESSLADFNFRLSYEGFGGTAVDEETSGLQIVTVTKDKLTERWLNIKEITEQNNMNVK